MKPGLRNRLPQKMVRFRVHPKAWQCALELRSDRSVATGSSSALCAAIRRGADLRVYTEFRHHEHIEPGSACRDLVQEIAEFRCTYLLEERWTAGIMTLRQPVALPDGFGPRASMSFFLYNQDGLQGIARPYLDGVAAPGEPGPAPVRTHAEMPRYHELANHDADTNAPASTFIYDFERFRFLVRDDWHEVLSHDDRGRVLAGSHEALVEAFQAGADVKIAVSGLCEDLCERPGEGPAHEVFIQAHSCYYYTDLKLLIAASQPLVRVRPTIPLSYATGGWDFGWIIARTDGHVAGLIYDPYTLAPCRRESRHAIRWLAR